MIEEYIKQHPNNGKVIIYTEAYLQMRHTLMEQIATIENATKGTLLSNDADINQRLLPSLKRSLKGLQKRFERGNCRVDARICAQYLLDMEREMITKPQQWCKHYKGTTESNDNDVATIEYYERVWVERWNTRENENYTIDMIAEFVCYGLLWFSDHDNTPISLKALLFNRYCHWNQSDVDGFKQWYNRVYLQKI